MEARKSDLKHSISDSLVRASRLEIAEDLLERKERKASDILIERSTLLRLGQSGGGEGWDPLMEGGRRALPELPITDDEVDEAIRGKRT